jgi:hypothetical protein
MRKKVDRRRVWYSAGAFFVLSMGLGAGVVALVVRGILPPQLALAAALSASVAGVILTAVEDGRAASSGLHGSPPPTQVSACPDSDHLAAHRGREPGNGLPTAPSGCPVEAHRRPEGGCSWSKLGVPPQDENGRTGGEGGSQAPEGNHLAPTWEPNRSREGTLASRIVSLPSQRQVQRDWRPSWKRGTVFRRRTEPVMTIAAV